MGIGSITFTGSVIACGKLHREDRAGRSLTLPGRHMLNLVLVILTVVCGVLFARAAGADNTSGAMLWLGLGTVLTGVIGLHLVAAIGGADMPVVVSMLNSYSAGRRRRRGSCSAMTC